MPVKRRSKSEKLRDLVIISDLYLHGYSQQAISDKLADIRPGAHSRRTVGNDIARLHVTWSEMAVDNHSKLIEAALARLDFLEREAYDQWEISKMGTTETTLYADVDEEGETGGGRAVTRDYEDQGRGDPKWWDRMMECVSARIRLIESGVGLKLNVGVQEDTRKWAEKAQSYREQWQGFAKQGRINSAPENNDQDGSSDGDRIIPNGAGVGVEGSAGRG